MAQQSEGLGMAHPVPFHFNAGPKPFKRCGHCGDKKAQCRKQKKCLLNKI
jgi:hypothetical protein